MNTDKHTCFCLIFLALLAGCASKSKPSTSPAVDPSSHELSQNPTIVLTAPTEWADMSLFGLHLGDSDSQIPKKKIHFHDDKSGWTKLIDANRYRITTDGKIDGLGMWDQTLLEKLEIAKEEQIEEKFGKPDDKIKVNEQVTIYHYQGGHLHVLWNGLEKRVVGVNVMK
jgi:hypothetical protein